LDINKTGREFDSNPVWEIEISTPLEMGDIRKYIIIDAVTGECNFDFNGVICS
jgi:hypothetical protein